MELSEKCIATFEKEGFPFVYEWTDAPSTIYEEHEHQDKDLDKDHPTLSKHPEVLLEVDLWRRAELCGRLHPVKKLLQGAP